MTSMFGRVTRFSATASRNPAEERLTEAFAATLEAAPALCEALTARWSKPYSDGNWSPLPPLPLGTPEVRTQRRANGRERVDIEMLFGPLARPVLRVWLELKQDADPDPDQLGRYLKALRELGGPHRLLLVAPSNAKFPEPGELPEETGIETWTGVATEIQRWLSAKASAGPDSYGQGLARAFATYLEEERLSTTEPFTLADALALQQHEQARSRMAEIVKVADSELANRFTIRTDLAEGGSGDRYKNRARDPLDFWRGYNLAQAGSSEIDGSGARRPPPGWEEVARDCYFEWHARDDADRVDRIGQRVFGAGLTLTGNWVRAREERDWFEPLEARGFELSARAESSGELLYLFRYRYPAEFVGAPNLQAQAEALQRWVVESFEIIAGSPPPVLDRSIDKIETGTRREP